MRYDRLSKPSRGENPISGPRPTGTLFLFGEGREKLLLPFQHSKLIYTRNFLSLSFLPSFTHYFFLLPLHYSLLYSTTLHSAHPLIDQSTQNQLLNSTTTFTKATFLASLTLTSSSRYFHYSLKCMLHTLDIPSRSYKLTLVSIANLLELLPIQSYAIMSASLFTLPFQAPTKSSVPESSEFVLQGVFVHPDHLSGFSDEISSSCDSSSIISYGTDDDEGDYEMSNDQDLGALYRDSRSSIQDSTDDYFAARPKSSTSSFYTGSTDSTDFSDGASFSSIDEDEEETATTPTPDSCHQAPSFSRRSSSYGELYPDLTSPAFPASFAFNTFAPSASRPSSRPSSPSHRSHPYLKSSSAMARSVSSPVETNRQVEQRKNAMLAFTASMDERANMVRSKSTPNAIPTPGGVVMSRSAAVSRAATPVSSPFLTPFEEGWGAELPPRSPQASTMLPFPYNLASPPSRFRFNRANSYAGQENHFEAPPKVEHRNSVPTIAVSAPSMTSSSSGMKRASSRRSSNLRPLTPIVAQSSEPQEGVCAALESFTFSPSPSSPPQMVRARLNRGLSF